MSPQKIFQNPRKEDDMKEVPLYLTLFCVSFIGASGGNYLMESITFDPKVTYVRPGEEIQIRIDAEEVPGTVVHRVVIRDVYNELLVAAIVTPIGVGVSMFLTLCIFCPHLTPWDRSLSVVVTIAGALTGTVTTILLS